MSGFLVHWKLPGTSFLFTFWSFSFEESVVSWFTGNYLVPLFCLPSGVFPGSSLTGSCFLYQAPFIVRKLLEAVFLTTSLFSSE